MEITGGRARALSTKTLAEPLRSVASWPHERFQAVSCQDLTFVIDSPLS